MSGTVTPATIVVKTTGQSAPGQKGRYMELMRKALTSKTKIQFDRQSFCPRGNCLGITTYRATRRANVNRYVRNARRKLFLNGFYSANLTLKKSGGIACKAVISALTGAIGLTPGAPAGVFFGLLSYAC